MADFKNLLVWQRSHVLNLRVAKMAATLRGSAFMSLRSQMVRAAHTIPSTIVEGREQNSDKEFARYLRMAINSSSELEYHLITAHALDGLSRATFRQTVAEVTEIRRMLYGPACSSEKAPDGVTPPPSAG